MTNELAWGWILGIYLAGSIILAVALGKWLDDGEDD